MHYSTTLETNELGQPKFRRDKPAWLDLSVHTCRDGGVEVDIYGSEGALLALADILIGVAKTPGFHVHLDQSLSGCPLSFNNDQLRLTVGNTDRPRMRDAPSVPPPDWARG